MQLGEVLGNRQAQAEAPRPSGRGRIGLSETVEDVRQELGRNSLAGVGDDNPHALVVGGHGHVDAAAGARELDRVVNQIPENLLDATAIRRDARQVGVTGRGQPDAFRVGGRLERLDRRVDGAPTSSGPRSRRAVPDVSLFISSRSSISLACSCALRWMTVIA